MTNPGWFSVSLKGSSQDEHLYNLAISREKLGWDIASREEGTREEGRMECQNEAQRAIVRKVLGGGLSPKTVMAVTDLSRAEIQQLQTEGPTRY
jgi:predicted transposase YdaD